MSIYVFLGPTVTVTDAKRILGATYLPPVRLGDVYRVVSQHEARAVGIIDGYFQWTPAVSHKEILWAISQGVHVFGAASMGALRAAELAPFGMHGVGRIFQAYCDGRFHGPDDGLFEDDDEVAVVHGPYESGYRGASEAMVNIRCTLARAAEQAVIAATTRRSLIAEAKALFFPDRSYPTLLARGRAGGLPERELTALEQWLPLGRIDQKHLDAVAMLEAMREHLAVDPPPSGADVAFERTTFWDRAEAAFRAAAEPAEAPPLAALRLDRSRCEHVDEDGIRDWFFASVAGIPVPEDLDGWVREVGFTSPAEFHRAAFAAYLERAHDRDGHP
jgi:hypothetical protein